MLVSGAPDVQILTKTSLKQIPGNKQEKNMEKKQQLCWPNVPEKLPKWGPEIHPKSIKIYKNLSLDPKVSFGVFPGTPGSSP